MLGSIITISVTGFIAGIIFAMPIAGPISILIVSNALKGRLRFSNQVTLGAAIPDFFYIFIGIYGVTKLYSWYTPAIPYLFLIGAVFFIALGLRIFRTPVDPESLEGRPQLSGRLQDKGRSGLYTGFMINLLNPTLFLSGLVSSFFVISVIAALGLNTGGLETKINDNVKEINSIDVNELQESIPVESLKKFRMNNNRPAGPGRSERPASFHLILSSCYAFFVSIGGIIWFYALAWILAKYRYLINIRVLSFLIRGFGVSLVLLGLYSGYLGITRLLQL